MKKTGLVLLGLLLINSLYAQEKYKQMMQDKTVNFYDVVKEAERYFETIDKTKKGSGWKGYMRWKEANEYKYYPSGKRDHIDPYFVENAYKNFLKNNNINLNWQRNFDNGWEELGPRSIDNITGHYSAGLGRIEDLYVDPNNANKIYLGSRSGGFWRTLDEGQNWEVTTDFLFATGVNTIAVAPTDSNHILINVRNARNGYSHGIYRSTDGGTNWVESNFNPTTVGFGGLGSDFRIYRIVFHPRVSNLIFVGTSKGIYRSDDNLATWTRLVDNGDITQIAFHPTDDNIVYIYDAYYWAANSNVVMRSTDQGLSYEPSNDVPNNDDDRSVYLSVSSTCPDCLYFASDNGVWKSTDKGVNFTFLNNPPEGCGGFSVSDIDHTKMVYGYVDLEASQDDGASFTNVTRWSLGNTNGAGNGHEVSFNTSTNYVHADLRVTRCINGVFYVGTDGLLCKSEDNGITWQNISQGAGIRENYKVGVSQSNAARSISGSQDNGTSILTENGWVEFYGADGMEGLIHPLNDDWMVGSLQNGGRRRTLDGGQTQNGITPSGDGDGADWEAPIVYDPKDQMTLYDFRTSVFKSEDFGNTWTVIGNPDLISNVDEAAIAQNDSDIIIVSSGSNIKKSTDGGETYIDIQGNLPVSTIQDIAIDPNNDNVIIVSFGNYENDGRKVYLSTNGGTSWSNITYNLGNMPIRTVVIDHTDESNIYLGGEIGIYTKPMSGNTWTLYSQNMPNVTVEELEIVYGSNTLKAVTWGRGLWEYALVGRNDYPSINTTRITHQPTLSTPKEGIDQYVTSTIDYDGTLTNVYVEWHIENAITSTIIPMSNTEGNTWVSDMPITNYPTGTKIYFKVFATGDTNDTSETYKFMYTVTPYEYCASSGTMIYQGNITLVDFNTINNPSGKEQPYTDYTATFSTEVTVNETYDLTVNLNTDNGNYQYYAKAWIDWNQDLIFSQDEAYELGFSQNVTDGPTDLSPFSITVPSNALVGETRMRVSCRYNGYATDCDQDYDGEVEDYRIIVRNNTVGIDDVAIDPSIITSYLDDNLHIEISDNSSIKEIGLYTILGQKLFGEKVEDSSISLPLVNRKGHLFIIKVGLENGRTLYKKIVLK